MNFLLPGAFLLGLLLPVIVAFYLLKLRRVEREVPSTYLWRKMVRDVEANAPWQRLRPNLLMILQLLFLLALILALARPFTWAEGISGQAAIFVLDTSASMAATDVQPSRIESAKQRARQLVDDLPDDARVTIIEAGREARVLLSSSLDRRQANLAIENAHAGTGGSDMTVALELASAIAARQPGTQIVVLSDGRVELPQRLALKGQLRYLPFGLTGENQAISLLNLTIAPGGETLTAFAQVSNYGEETVSRRLSLYVDGQLANAFDVNDIHPGSSKSVIAEGLPGFSHQVEARLDQRPPELDALPLDDRALAVRPDTQPVPVSLVTPGNRFLKIGLSLLPGVQLTEQQVEPPAAPEGTGTPAAAGTAAPTATAAATPTLPAASTSTVPPALTIYDAALPDTLPASGSLLFIAPPRSTEFFTTTGLAENPLLRVVDPADPLLANLALEDITLQDTVTIPLPAWATPVLSGDLEEGNTPLLFRGEVNGRRIAVLAFDLRHSDLTLQVAFPLLLANTINWLVPGAGSAVPPLVEPGETLSFSAPPGVQQATIRRPDGATIPLQVEAGRFFFNDTVQLGEYTVSLPAAGDIPSRQAAFTVNLFSPGESNLKPADSLPNLSAQAGSSGANAQKAIREWWRPLALLALGLLIGEWLVYQRAALVRLRDRLIGRRQAPARYERLRR